MFKIRLISLFREIWQTKTRFLSIFAIAAIGVGFFAGVKATEPDMRESVNDYYVDSRMSHFVLSSPLGFDLDDLEEIEDSINKLTHNDSDVSASGGFCEDNLTYHEQVGEIALRIMSYSGYLNKLTVVEGKLPRKNDECAVLADNGIVEYKIGDKISLDDDASLKEKTLTVTALVKSPMYMSKVQYGTTDIGDGSLSAVAFVTESAFDMTYYNRVYIYDKYLTDKVYYSKRFNNAYDRLEQAVEKMCDDKYEYFRQEGKTDYTDLHLDLFSIDMQKSAVVLDKTYTKLSERKNQIENDAEFLRKTQSYFDDHDDIIITADYSYSAYFAALLKMTKYDENGLPIADYTCEGLYNLVTAEKYTVDSYMYYKYQRYLLTLINDAQKETFNADLKKYNDSFDKFKDAFNEATEDLTAIWYCSSNDDLPAYTEYGNNAERIGNIAKIFPVFFLFVAALVCLTTMTRMVDENRTNIGTRKALGFSDTTILGGYLVYAMLASVAGSVVGVLVGFKLFPNVIINAYNMIYVLPETQTPFRWDLAIISVSATLLCMGFTVVVSCSAELFKTPAKLLRPKAPQKGKKILFERVKFIWNKLTFIQKVTLRNIFRYKKRMVMTVIGIAGCTALVLTAFGLKNSISDIVRLQFDDIMKYDMSANFTDWQEAQSDIADVVGQDDSLLVMQKTGTVKKGNDKAEVTLFVPEDSQRLSDFIALRSRTDGKDYQLAENDIIITEKLATMLGVSEGNIVDIYVSEDNVQSFYVYAITENYAYHYAYIPQSLYSKTLGEVEYNTALLNVDNQSNSKIAEKLLNKDSIQAVRQQNEIKDNFDDILSMLDSVIAVLIVSAGALAFVVLFNLSNINITERYREIATLKVLGFNNRQTGSYIIRENIILSVIGTAVGLLFGRVLVSFVIKTAEIDLVMFGRDVYFESYLFAAIITLVFAIAVSLIMNVRIKKIDMVESLKSVE